MTLNSHIFVASDIPLGLDSYNFSGTEQPKLEARVNDASKGRTTIIDLDLGLLFVTVAG